MMTAATGMPTGKKLPDAAGLGEAGSMSAPFPRSRSVVFICGVQSCVSRSHTTPQKDSEMSGISPGNSGKLKQGNCKQVSDVAQANFLIEQIGGKRRVGDMVHAAAKELNKRFPHKTDPQNKWTERRLRGWWNRESNVVKHFQMMELFDTAEQLRKARQDHADFMEKTTRIRALAELTATHGAGGVAEK